MTKQEKLYDTLGELLFVIAKADGVIQNEEIKSLNHLLKNNPWASQIKWSFDYEVARNSTVEETYNKVINFCHGYGPTAEYEEFIAAMKIIAKAAEGITTEESEIINSFSADLIERFQRDIKHL